MAKDPAVLFYTSDFLTGTILMSDSQIGKYIKLLCIQHQKDILSESDMMNICKSYDKDVFDKFVKTDAGYYNERMKNEKEKRSSYCKGRSENRLKGIDNKTNIKPKKPKKTYVKHMENEIENVNKDINTNKIIYPFDSDTFKEKWKLWNAYRKEKGCPYKTETSEQMALKKLSEFDEQFAIELIETSISNQWQGLIFAKTKQEYNDRKNGNSKAKFGTKPSLSDVEAEINRLYPDAAK